MPYYDVANLVTVTKTNMIHQIGCGYWFPRTTAVRRWHQVSHRAGQRSQLLSKSPADQRRGHSSSNISQSSKLCIGVSWMHLHNCGCFQNHLRMLLQSLRALSFAPGGPWKRLEVQRCTGKVDQSIWEAWVWLADLFTFCWWISPHPLQWVHLPPSHWL